MYTTKTKSSLQQLKTDLQAARRSVPESAETMLAASKLLVPADYRRLPDLLSTATERYPVSTRAFAELAFGLQRVGRMSDAIVAARRRPGVLLD